MCFSEKYNVLCVSVRGQCIMCFSEKDNVLCVVSALLTWPS